MSCKVSMMIDEQSVRDLNIQRENGNVYVQGNSCRIPLPS